MNRTMQNMLMKLACVWLALGFVTARAEGLGNYQSHTIHGRSVRVTSSEGETLRFTPYGDYMLRVQVAKKGQALHAR